MLREAFDYPYGRIAELLHLRPANCRQLVRRARVSIASDRGRSVGATAHRQLVAAFLAAARGGDVNDLERLLVHAMAVPTASGARSGDYDPAAA